MPDSPICQKGELRGPPPHRKKAAATPTACRTGWCNHHQTHVTFPPPCVLGPRRWRAAPKRQFLGRWLGVRHRGL